MFLIVGLGNPGLAYAYTRHNVGFLFIDHFSHEYGFPDFKSKFESLFAEKSIDGERFLIQKPQTFMNLSGKAVLSIISFYKIPTENVFVVHDDIDIPPFGLRIKFGGGHGGHNGLKDIDRSIGKNYWRIRIGVGRPVLKDEVASYVLSAFYKEEITEMLPKVFDPLIAGIPALIKSENKDSIVNKIIGEIKGK